MGYVLRTYRHGFAARQACFAAQGTASPLGTAFGRKAGVASPPAERVRWGKNEVVVLCWNDH
ncbi:hypothetical protein GCM10027271_49890 [Saccharopolyspora gloriosae]